jgi:uncharacterized membrane-anchored protein
VVAIWYDRLPVRKAEAGYWVAIVMMRAAATNLADMITHDFGLGYIFTSVILAVMTLGAAYFTTPDLARANSPRVDGAYWAAMFIAGLFGTVAGDYTHHSIGLFAASVILCTGLACLIAVRHSRAPASVLLFWIIVMIERCAGTALGDALASRRAVGLGLPLATAITLCLTVVCLWLHARLVQSATSHVAQSGQVGDVA